MQFQKKYCILSAQIRKITKGENSLIRMEITMVYEDAYEKYKKIEDLPVNIKVIVPPEGMVRKGIIQFHHGMAEHKGRYNHVLQYFSNKGYICAIHDARGHGESMENDSELGYFGENGADTVVEDAHAVTAYLKNNYPDLPFILIGHSFGSLVARAYIKKYDYELDRAFIIGSPSDNKMKAAGMLLIELITIFKSDKEVSPFVQKLFDSQFDKVYRKKCQSGKRQYVKNGQICSEESVVEAYTKDKKSGFPYTLNGYYTIMDVMTRVYSGSVNRWIMKNKNLKITFLSGEDDVYLIDEKKFLQAVNKMKEIGYKNTDYKLYKNMYHEIFNEAGREQVFNDILEMLDTM